MNNKIANESLGEYIARLRKSKGYSQRKFAQLSGLSNTTISRIEKGETINPDLETIKLIAHYLNIDELTLLAQANMITPQADVFQNDIITEEIAAATEDFENTKIPIIEKPAPKAAVIKKEINNASAEAVLKGMHLITLRLERNITQKELGDALGLDKTTISQYEGEIKKPDYETLLKIADYFEVPVSYLTGVKEENIKYIEEENIESDFTISSTHDIFQLRVQNTNKSVLAPEYLELAMEIQNNNIDPEDIRSFMKIICKKR